MSHSPRCLLAGCLLLLNASPAPAQCPSGGPGSAPALEDALLFSEQREGGKLDSVPGQHRPIIDYKSRLIIKPQVSMIRCMVGGGDAVLPVRSAGEKERLLAGEQLIKGAARYLQLAESTLTAVAAVSATPTPAEIQRLQGLISAQGAAGRAVVSPIIAAATARARLELGAGASEDAIESAVGALTSDLMVDARGNDVILNVPVLAEFVRREIEFITPRVATDAQIAEEQGTVRFRMRAYLARSGNSVAVSVQNYDDIENLDGPKRPRIAFRLNAEEQERLAQGLAAAATASQLVRDLRARGPVLRDGIDQLAQAAKREIDGIASLGPPLLTLARDSLPAVSRDLLGRMEARFRPTITALDASIVQFRARLDTILIGVQLLKAAAADPGGRGLFNLAVVVPGAVGDAMANAVQLRPIVELALPRLDTLIKAMTETPQMVGDLAPRVGGVLKRARGALDSAASRFMTLAQAVQTVINRRQVVELGDRLAGPAVDPSTRALRLDAIVPGTVFVDATPADGGDDLVVVADLVRVDSAGQVHVLQTSRRPFQVERTGLTSEVTSHLILAQRRNVPNETFDPSPGASWMLHYRTRSKDAWSRIDPGIGIGVATLDFDGHGLEVGLGVQVSVFNDLLTYGEGYNLSVTTNRRYRYIGIGLLQVLNSVGGLVGLAGKARGT